MDTDSTRRLDAEDGLLNNDGNFVVLIKSTLGNGYYNLDSIFINIYDQDLNVLHSTRDTPFMANANPSNGMAIDSYNNILCTHNRKILTDSTQIGEPLNDNLTVPWGM